MWWVDRFRLRASRADGFVVRKLNKDALLRRIAESKAKYAETKECAPLAAWWISEYMLSIHFLGENSLENAKKLGALDAKELYPDITQMPFKEYVKKFYKEGGMLA